MEDRRIKVLVAEDLEPLRRRYAETVAGDRRFELAAAVATGAEAVAEAERSCPELVLMDIEMEDRKAGIAASRGILAIAPETKIIILTVYDLDELVFEAFEAGVVDYLTKDSSREEIVASLWDAYKGTSPIRPLIAEKMRREFKRLRRGESAAAETLRIATSLTPTEIDILELLRRGMTRSEICSTRHIEMSTVKTHINLLLRKLDRPTTAAAIEELDSMGFFDALRARG
jgi:Response regulator containing a CheY-like receiver domain and an HTH DNA-binding domain